MRADLARFLSPVENPLFQSPDDIAFFTAHRNGFPVGRITAHIHRASNARHNETRAHFGFFDCGDDPDAARALLTYAETWAKARGMTEIAGNFNLTAMQQAGVVTDGFDAAPYTDQIYNPPHIVRLLEANGYARDFPMTTSEIDLQSLDPARLLGPKQRRISPRASIPSRR
ncbi:hypothetical protein [Paracoccus cavernae]|uniref:hypothetical protein n=1 Tax=Paracoccus cavernae TaxID=1571207 RepID=UPI0036408EE6